MLDGYFRGKIFVLPIRIYYADTDVSGVVYHANYLNYMERARSEFFRAVGITKLIDLESAEPTAWALRSVALDYVRPARLDDVIEIRTCATKVSGARLDAEQMTYCGDTLLVRGRVQACVITLSGKPRRLPAEVHAKLEPYICPEGA